LESSLFTNFILQLLDQLRHVRVGPRQNFASQRTARQASIVQLRNRNHRAANSIESDHDADSPNLADKIIDKAV
jgi:hypothetical protein